MSLNCVEHETFEEYKAKIEAIVEQLLSGEKHLVIWGAGENGERFKRYCDAIHMPVQCLVDNNSALWETKRWGLPIIAPKALVQLEDIVILISFPGARVVQEVAAQLEETLFDKMPPYFDDNLFYLLQNTVFGRTETVAEIIVSMYKSVTDDKYLHMPVLTPEITTKCSLHCRDCIARIPYRKEHRDADLAAICADIDRVLELVDSVKRLDVCGGEPFLYKNLVPFLDKAKRYNQIFSIFLITNGTIMPKNDVFDAMENSNISVKISDYGELSQKKEQLQEECKKRNIPCYIQNSNWFELFSDKKLDYSQEELQKMFDSCVFKDCCIRIGEGAIYRCGLQLVWGRAGPAYDTKVIKKDGVDLNDRTDDKALKRRLKEHLRTTVPFEICKYCRGNTKPIPRAIQLKEGGTANGFAGVYSKI